MADVVRRRSPRQEARARRGARRGSGRPARAAAVPGVEARQLRGEHGRLEVEPAVAPAAHGSAFATLTEAPSSRTALGDRRVVRDDRPAVSDRPEVLRRIEAERGRVAERPARRPPKAAPWAWAASSTSTSPCSRANAGRPPCRRTGRRGGRRRSPASAVSSRPRARPDRAWTCARPRRRVPGSHRRPRCRRPSGRRCWPP